MKEKEYKVGDKIETPFSDRPDGMSTILEIYPYHSFREEYRKMFSLVLRVTAPRTKRGWMEICV
jgi:hypothetical protein